MGQVLLLLEAVERVPGAADVVEDAVVLAGEPPGRHSTRRVVPDDLVEEVIGPEDAVQKHLGRMDGPPVEVEEERTSGAKDTPNLLPQFYLG